VVATRRPSHEHVPRADFLFSRLNNFVFSTSTLPSGLFFLEDKSKVLANTLGKLKTIEDKTKQ